MTDLESSSDLSKASLTQLGGISIEQFLREYWQKKPLLIKKAFPKFENPLDADEIAGLSLEPESQARLIQEADNSWKVRHGPFDESVFTKLPEERWTLLVQHADALDPDVNALLSSFRFLPNWRLDDIMVSYACNLGGVGPHFDYYDVFLLQGAGKRRWRTGQRCDENSPLVPDQDMKILADFDCVNDWQVEAGDLIYIPAKVAHWGEAIDESITYSIGFRSPSHSELLLDSTQNLNAELNEDQRYEDGDEILSNINNTGLIPEEAIKRVQKDLVELVNKPDMLAHWLAETSTQLKDGLQPEQLPLAFASAQDCLDGKTVTLSPFCRSAHIDVAPQPACYINGQCYSMNIELAEKLSAYKEIDPKTLTANEVEILAQLCDYSLMLLVE